MSSFHEPPTPSCPIVRCAGLLPSPPAHLPRTRRTAVNPSLFGLEHVVLPPLQHRHGHRHTRRKYTPKKTKPGAWVRERSGGSNFRPRFRTSRRSTTHPVPSLNVTFSQMAASPTQADPQPTNRLSDQLTRPGPWPGSSISKRDLAGSIGGAGQGLMLF